MTTRRRRILTGDEMALWAHVTRHVDPLASARAKERARERAEDKAVAAGDLAPGEHPAGPGVPPPAQPSAKAPPGKYLKPAWKRDKSPKPRPGAEAPKLETPSPPAPPPLAPLERRLRQRLSRGSHPIDAVIDLHGLRQEEAHGALRGFLHAAQRQGHTVVLVVTGKGGAAAGQSLFEERGVLRRIVPHWLRLPDLRSVVVGFEEAVQHHGGTGALYVRLRKTRSTTP